MVGLWLAPAPAVGQDYALPIRWCVVGDDANGNGVADAGEEGAPAFTDPGLVGEPDTDNVLWRRHERISDRTYIPQAGVTLRSALWNIVEDATLRFPIIPDPDTSDPDHEYGDLLADPRDERDLARDACIGAWQDDHGVADIGIIAIVARRLVDADGEPTANGVGRLGARLLWVHDNGFVLPNPTPEADLRDPVDGTLGHELGHAHPGALNHVANDSNIMRSSPADVEPDGVRDNFDLSSSIVEEDGDMVDQIDLIHDNSPSVPGCKIFGTNMDCSTRSDAHVDPPGDVEERFLDLRLITLADRDGTSTRIALELNGPLDTGVLDFETIEYSVFLDLDGDATTGGAPATLGFDTAFPGAEVVVRVEVSPAVIESTPEFVAPDVDIEGGLPRLTTRTRFWRFDPRRRSFSEIDNADVLTTLVPIIDIIDPIAPGGRSVERLVGHTIEIVFPNAIRGPIAERPRLQAVSRGVRDGGAVVDRLDESPEEAGVPFRLVSPTFPVCEASPDPVAPGSQLQVRASGLLGERVAKVILGDDRIGQGETDAGGGLAGSFPVPLGAREGKRLLTVGIMGTALTADCPVTVERRRAPRRLFYSFHVGSAHPLGDLNELADANIYVQADVGLPLSDRLDAVARLGFAQLTAETATGIEHPHWAHLSVNAQLFTVTATGLRPYVQAGPGLYEAKAGGSDPGFNVGLGVRIPLPAPFELELGGDFHHIDDEPGTQLLTLQLGARFH